MIERLTKGSRFHAQWKAQLAAAGINTPLRLAAYFAQCDHESGGFTRLVENLNYSSQRLAEIWPNRFAVDPKAAKKVPNKLAISLHRRPEAIANTVYANRMGNGAPETGDGWRFRGRGFIQLTGRSNYTAYFPLAVANPDIVAEPEHAVRSSIWFWNSRNLNRFADAGDIVGMTRVINGGTIGLRHRQQLYQEYLKIFS